MAEFIVIGPFDMPYEKRRGGRVIKYKQFWAQSEKLVALASGRGCYIFAIRTRRGATPIYVGKATRSFKGECFNPGNRVKFANGFADFQIGKPVLYFVRLAPRRGKTNAKQIGEVEIFLISSAQVKNPNIQNVHGKQAPKWTIRGVIRSGRAGKPTNAESDLKQLLGIR